ncbi:hypothetical protein GCM10009850_083120 [Nonomuraea monospora]|uniref:Uncharacterized protein n=1 Tax=Nonomuraea monospora TaxID=568818 RepID=A0ABP5PMB6_9ACTN
MTNSDDVMRCGLTLTGLEPRRLSGGVPGIVLCVEGEAVIDGVRLGAEQAAFPPVGPPAGLPAGLCAGLPGGLRAGLCAGLRAGPHAGLPGGLRAGLRGGLRGARLTGLSSLYRAVPGLSSEGRQA